MPAVQNREKASGLKARATEPYCQRRGESRAEVRGRFHSADAGCSHGGVFILGSALAAADDGAGMAHAAPRRSGLAGDEADYRLFHIDLDPLGGALFGVAADFADQNNGVRLWIIVEKLDGVEERRADDGVAADADAGGLANAEFGELMNGFVSECAAAADHGDVALLVDAAGHDANFAFAWRDDAGAVLADEARFLEVHDGGDAHHVERGDAFGNTDDQRELGIGSFQDCVGRIPWRN